MGAGRGLLARLLSSREDGWQAGAWASELEKVCSKIGRSARTPPQSRRVPASEYKIATYTHAGPSKRQGFVGWVVRMQVDEDQDLSAPAWSRMLGWASSMPQVTTAGRMKEWRRGEVCVR